MKYMIIFLIIFSIQTLLLSSEFQTLNNEICINDIVISSTSYKTEGQIPYITVQIENLSDKEIYDIELVLTSDNSFVHLVKLLKSKETKVIHFPWIPEIGINDFTFDLKVEWISDTGEEETLCFSKVKSAKTLLS